MQIYLDHSATTPPRPEAIAAMTEALTRTWGNPSSLHEWGARSATVLEQARSRVAALINGDPAGLIFTSGGTEANNLAILGLAHRCSKSQHLIISSVEHAAIARPAAWLESQGWAVTRLPVNRQGRVNPAQVARSLRPDTALISVIYGQSEVGTLQPIEAIGAIARAAGVLFHTDAVQAAGRVAINLQTLPVDLLSLSSHKLYGPQGAGALYVRPGVTLDPHLLGGPQEDNRRGGTQALPAIAGFGVAAELAREELPQESERLTALRDRLFDQLVDLPEVIPTGDRLHRLCHHVSLCLRSHPDFPSPSGRDLVRHCDRAGIAVSAGSACNSGKIGPSPILQAMGHSDAEALTGLRLTLGRSTTAADIDWTALTLRQILARSRHPHPQPSLP
ncbi:MAG: cysteine desulfurase [Cyanobacteria bacterium]|nr:cysteine desulfurase [Cyanobacteriota bacterium]